MTEAELNRMSELQLIALIEKNDPAIPFTEIFSCPPIQSRICSALATFPALESGLIGSVWRKTVVAMLPDVIVALPVITVPLAVADRVNCVGFDVVRTKYCCPCV